MLLTREVDRIAIRRVDLIGPGGRRQQGAAGLVGKPRLG